MEDIIIGQKLDELLSRRESLQNSLRNMSNMIKQGIEAYQKLPDRWYVRNPSEKVIEYLEKKHERTLTRYDYSYHSVGYGEFHGEFTIIPHDVNYSWQITEDEFLFGISFIK